jgi:hypothetical protein
MFLYPPRRKVAWNVGIVQSATSRRGIFVAPSAACVSSLDIYHCPDFNRKNHTYCSLGRGVSYRGHHGARRGMEHGLGNPGHERAERLSDCDCSRGGGPRPHTF